MATVKVDLMCRWRTPRLDKALRYAMRKTARCFPEDACFLFNLGHRGRVYVGDRHVSTLRPRAHVDAFGQINVLL